MTINTDTSLADAVRQRVRELNGNGEGDYCYTRRSRVMPWGDNHTVEAAMLEIADVLDQWSREGKYKDENH